MKIKDFKVKLEVYMKRMKAEIGGLYFAYSHEDMPLHAKIMVGIVVGYALSPIDLIPDFIPILGYLDDMILLPLGIALAIKLIPPEIMDESRERAREAFEKKALKNWKAGVIILLFWATLLGLFILKLIN